jgi:hypothetical protein
MDVKNNEIFNRISMNDAQIENIFASISEINNEIKDLKLEDEKITGVVEENWHQGERNL